MLQTRRFFGVSARTLQVPTYKVAVVGTGPAGFYTGYHILSKSPVDQFKVQLDFFEKLPAPYGLSRYGVAPDHPEVKNCEEYLNDLMDKFSGPNEPHRARFLGNITIGRDITLKQLQESYHSVVLAYGCISDDNKLNIPGADLPGVVSARQLVNWYNGHPEFYNGSFVPPDFEHIEDVTIVGNGNVALDVARVLLADPKSHWSPTDISIDAVKALEKSKVKNVNIVARRGLLESAFSNKEIRELLELNNTKKVKFVPVDSEIMDQIKPHAKTLDRVNKRRVSILEKYVTNDSDSDAKTWSLKYLLGPKEFIQSSENKNLLSSTVFTKNDLVHDDLTQETKVKPTDKTITLKNELVVLSIGYKGSPIDGFEENDISFDTKTNRILNVAGRVLTKVHGDHKNVYKKGFYTSGWIKKGPKGVIATTMMEAFETADNVIEDLLNGTHTEGETKDLALPSSVVFWNNWLKLNKYELEDGKKRGKTRNKVCTAQRMIDIACK